MVVNAYNSITGGVETEKLHQIEGQSALQSDQCIQVYWETLSQKTETESKETRRNHIAVHHP